MAEAQGSSSSVEDDNAAAMDGIYNNGRLSFRDNGGVMLPGSFSKAADLKPKRRSVGRSTCPDGDDIINLLHGSDPIKVELNRLENEVRDKDRELAEAHAEIKASKNAERLAEKAVEEVILTSQCSFLWTWQAP
jgi:hypothetical protein